MKRTIAKSLLVSTLLAISSAWLFGQGVDPKAIAKLVTEGKIKFSAKSAVVIWVNDKQYYSIEPIVSDHGDTYPASAAFGTDAKSMAVGQAPTPPRPPAPPPHDHTPPRPVPIPPRPPRPRPSDHQPPKKSLAELAEQGTVVGRLETDGISETDLNLPKGSYTIVLTIFEGKPVASLIDASGEYVRTFDEVFFQGVQ